MNEVSQWLDKLSYMKSSEIRNLMVKEGIKGTICKSLRCPLAKFLHQKTGLSVSVGRYRRVSN
jgi:hypothetical protein